MINISLQDTVYFNFRNISIFTHVKLMPCQMYFKTVSLPSGTNQSQAEISLRKAAIKETMSLDFKFKAIDIGTDKTRGYNL